MSRKRVFAGRLGCGWWQGGPFSSTPHHGYRIGVRQDGSRKGVADWPSPQPSPTGLGGRSSIGVGEGACGGGAALRPCPMGTGCPRYVEEGSGSAVGWVWLVEGGTLLVHAPPWVPDRVRQDGSRKGVVVWPSPRPSPTGEGVCVASPICRGRGWSFGPHPGEEKG